MHPTSPLQVVVSYFQAGRICDYITDKWGWDTILAMLHDFGAGEDTAAVIRKELKMEPEEFDKRVPRRSWKPKPRTTVENFDDWKKRVKQIERAVRRTRTTTA